MDSLPPRERRTMDGPVRRVPQPIQPISPGQEPVFVYRKPKRFVFPVRKTAQFAGVTFMSLVLVLVGWFGFVGLKAAKSIMVKSSGAVSALNGDMDLTKLKGEGDGRVNILVLGIGGAGHDGPNLSDTMMVFSLDPKTKDVAMVSIPRDLYVKIPGHGSGKINAANSFGGPDLAKKVVENVLGVPIHYYAVVDFSGFRQAVDAVGGVDINVEEAINDMSFPCDNDRGICPLHIKAGMQHMSGVQALRYSRSRHTTSDFDRASRQQKVLVALRNKALQASTLTNPVKLAGLISAVGSHFKTDLQLNEMKKLALIAKDIDPAKATQKVLDTSGEDSLLVDGSGTIPGAGSIELPRKGNFDYSDIHDFIKNIFVDHYITDEHALVEVQNGSEVTGLAGGVVKSLKAAHYNLADPTNAAEQVDKTVIYDFTGGSKPYTLNYLEKRFKVKAVKKAKPSPVPNADGTVPKVPDIKIVLGNDYETTSTTQ